MIVTDASALVVALVLGGPGGRAAHRLLDDDPRWTAPDHWMVETFNALRGLTLGGKIPPEDGTAAVRRLPSLSVAQVPIDELLPRMWQLRDRFTGYDAAYVALAESDDLTLVTADHRLARAAVQHCRVELVRPSA